jgi:oligopeptide transport system substrate-binding protein
MLKAIGVSMELVDVEYGAFLKARNAGDFELIAFSLAPFGDIEDFTAALYRTGASRNFGNWGNADLDQLFDQGRRELDVPKRKAIFRSIQAVLAENCWVIDIPRYTSFEVWHPYVKDYVPAQNPERGLGFWRTWLAK